jgi:hypothetical protein
VPRNSLPLQVLRARFCLLPSAFCFLPLPLAWLQQQRQAPPPLDCVSPDVMLLDGKGPGLRQAGAGLELRRVGAPGIPVFSRQRLVFAPGPRGGAESGPGGLLGRRARVFGNDVAAPTQPPIGPIISHTVCRLASEEKWWRNAQVSGSALRAFPSSLLRFARA